MYPTVLHVSFSWGPAAVSNAMWTGVWVKDILKHIGIKSFEEGGKHVCFVGADKLPNGYYGTSIRREVRTLNFCHVLYLVHRIFKFDIRRCAVM